jgi:hypothetical protein
MVRLNQYVHARNDIIMSYKDIRVCTCHICVYDDNHIKACVSRDDITLCV